MNEIAALPLAIKDLKSNAVLAALTSDDQSLLLPHLEPVAMPLRHVFEEPGIGPSHVLFPISGIISILVKINDASIEVGLIGREGMTGGATVLGATFSPFEMFVQFTGRAYQVPTQTILRLAQERPSMKDVFLRAHHILNLQTCYTAYANGRCSIELRLARWLLMTHDRTQGDTVLLTHEFLSLMLGVRRSGVTIALQVLEGEGLIRSERGQLTVISRAGLLEKARGIYGIPEMEAKRLGFVGSPYEEAFPT